MDTSQANDLSRGQRVKSGPLQVERSVRGDGYGLGVY